MSYANLPLRPISTVLIGHALPVLRNQKCLPKLVLPHYQLPQPANHRMIHIHIEPQIRSQIPAGYVHSVEKPYTLLNEGSHFLS